jgi:hypothetical protein
MSSITLTITPDHFKELMVKGYSIDSIVMLKLYDNDEKVKEELDLLLLENKRIELIKQTLIRKALLTEDNKITSEGRSILDFLSSSVVGDGKKIEKRKMVSVEDFTKWWSTFPGTDTFTHKGKTFTGGRALRVKKDDCRMIITKIVGEGEYTIDDLVKALEMEVLQKKENSVKTGVNRLTFMQSTVTYLNQRTFEPFIELAKTTNIEDMTSSTGGTDI